MNKRIILWFFSLFLFGALSSCVEENLDGNVGTETNEDDVKDNINEGLTGAAIYREFENGVVLVNLSDNPYVFDLEELFPGQNFRRLQASTYGDQIVNNGQTVGATVTLPRRDALFLIKE